MDYQQPHKRRLLPPRSSNTGGYGYMEIGNPREITPLAFFPQDKQHTWRAGVTIIENGLPFDEVLQKRSQETTAEKELLLVELAGVRWHVALPMDRILPSNIEAFSIATRYRRRAATPG